MEVSIYFVIINLLLLLDFGQTKPFQDEELEDHLYRPDLNYNEDYEEVTFSFNDHVTFGNIDLDSDPEDKTLSDMDIIHLDNQLTTENELFEDNDSNDERKTSRMLNVLSRGLLKMIRKPEPDFDYEIEDRIVRYAMNNMREEI